MDSSLVPLEYHHPRLPPLLSFLSLAFLSLAFLSFSVLLPVWFLFVSLGSTEQILQLDNCKEKWLKFTANWSHSDTFKDLVNIQIF